MQVYDMIVDERRHMADLLSALSADQLRQPSLCAGWTVHDVAAHLVTYLRFGQAKLYLGIVGMGADFDRLNVWLTRRAARRPSREIAGTLRRRAGSRVTIPRSGYDPVLTDIVVHDLDIRVPLGIARTIPEDRLWVSFHHLAVAPSPGFAMGDRLHGLRLVATDTGWHRGTGAALEGRAEDLLLAIAGRAAVLDRLHGDGLPLLRRRLAGPRPRVPVRRRLAAPLAVLRHPPPPERRSRAATAPPVPAEARRPGPG
jgi:uncharacterized protein (TIGR03083 family)